MIRTNTLDVSERRRGQRHTVYVVYVDDSGTKEYANKPDDYTRGGNCRYFVFGGVLLNTAESGLLSERIRALKRAFFGTDTVEVKSNWLRIPPEREARYKRRYNVDDQQITNFVSSYYDLIADADLRLFAVVIDKVHVAEDYATPWYAPAIAYELLLQRVVQEVRLPERVSVQVDDMTGATPKGRQYRANLIAHHAQLQKHGSSLQKGIDFSSLVARIRFVDSAHSHLIQVADIVAYNVFRQFVDHGEYWETGKPDLGGKISLPTYPWFSKLGKKFRQGPNGRVQGFGVVKFPLRNRIRWVAK
jgi:hypothetical protein